MFLRRQSLLCGSAVRLIMSTMPPHNRGKYVVGFVIAGAVAYAIYSYWKRRVSCGSKDPSCKTEQVDAKSTSSDTKSPAKDLGTKPAVSESAKKDSESKVVAPGAAAESQKKEPEPKAAAEPQKKEPEGQKAAGSDSPAAPAEQSKSKAA